MSKERVTLRANTEEVPSVAHSLAEVDAPVPPSLSGRSSLSLACFLEGISPQELPLSGPDAELVAQEVDELLRLPAAEAFAISLEELAEGGEG